MAKGQWLHQYSRQSGRLQQLVVVGDFASQDDAFRHAVHQMMQEHHVRLYDLNEVQPLIEDIRSHGQMHLSN
jgi:Arc/MetJ-type ribon-helix-helix transcriptional regulator